MLSIGNLRNKSEQMLSEVV
jgi:hypothetical protein